MATDYLKRIEEKVKETTFMEDSCADIHLGDDVVKLARALDPIVHPPENPDWDQIMTNAERTLAEVAGVSDE